MKDGPISIKHQDVSDTYILLTENKYQVGLKALSKYNRLAYKQLIFEILPALQEGKTPGELIDDHYELHLICDQLFSEIYGKIYLCYYISDRNVVLTSIEPFDILSKLHRSLVGTSEGVPILDAKAKFKLSLLNRIKEK